MGMFLKKKDSPQSFYDVIVIGSGLGGMTAANKLALAGRKVLLLESHNKLGGLATWFRRNQGEYIFDISLHGFPIGMKKTCRKYWGKDIADSIIQVKDIRFINPQFQIKTDFTKEDYSRLLVEKFQIPSEVVDSFFKKLNSMNFYDKESLSNGELFEEFFPGRNDVIRFLLEPIVYANGSGLDDEAITYGIVFSNFMDKGVYIFQGGTDQLILKMQEKLLENGVDIKMHSKVEKIFCDEDRKVSGIELNGQIIHTSSIVSNANLLSTIFDIGKECPFSEEFLYKAEKVRLNSSSCQVFMGIKKGEKIPRVGDLIFYSEEEKFSQEALLGQETTSQTFSVYYPEIRPHLNDHYAIVSSMNARYQDWENLNSEQYEGRKKQLIEKALRALEKIIPDIREKIDFIEASTPKTIESYTHHPRGTSFGTKFEGLDISMNLHKEVPGLFHTGSVGIIMSGWLGAANYGVIQAHNVDNYLDKLK